MVYVVEVGQISLAFKAGTKTQALQIMGSHWFACALDRYHVKASGSERIMPRLRTATTSEFVLFHDMSAEFAEAAGGFLLARVG